jgi:hypothetical protein
MAETILRQFHVSGRYTGQLTIARAERLFGVDIRPLALGEASDSRNRPLKAGSLISVEGDHDNVYRLFNVLCPGTLRPEQVAALNVSEPSPAPESSRVSTALGLSAASNSRR